MKLLFMTGETEHERLRVLLRKIIMDERSPEGRTREHFIENFAFTQGIDALRNFSEGFVDYIATNRRRELQRVMVDVSFRVEEDDRMLRKLIRSILEESIYQALYKTIYRFIALRYDPAEEARLVKKLRQLSTLSQVK